MGAESLALCRQIFQKGLEELDELENLPKDPGKILLADHSVEHKRWTACTKSS